MTETVSLTEEQAAFAQSLVDDGRYASVSAVVQDSIDLLREQAEGDPWHPDNMDPEDRAALKQLLTERAPGPFISMDEFRRRTDAMLAQKVKERTSED